MSWVMAICWIKGKRIPHGIKTVIDSPPTQHVESSKVTHDVDPVEIRGAYHLFNYKGSTVKTEI